MGGARVLVGIWMLVPGMVLSAHAAEPPAKPTIASTKAIAADPVAPFQAWLDAWMRDTAESARLAQDATLPTQPAPGLDLRISPDDESVYLGWRTRF